MSQSEQTEHVEHLKRMLAENEQLRRQVQATLDALARPLKSKKKPESDSSEAFPPSH